MINNENEDSPMQLNAQSPIGKENTSDNYIIQSNDYSQRHLNIPMSDNQFLSPHVKSARALSQKYNRGKSDQFQNFNNKIDEFNLKSSISSETNSLSNTG